MVSKLIEQRLPTQAPPTASTAIQKRSMSSSSRNFCLGRIGVGKGVRLECVKSPERSSDEPAEQLLDIENEGLLVSYLRSKGWVGARQSSAARARSVRVSQSVGRLACRELREVRQEANGTGPL